MSSVGGNVQVDIDSYLDLPYDVYLLDMDGKYLECNAIQAKRLGLANKADVIGQSLNNFDFLNAQEVEDIKLNNYAIKKTKKPKVIIEKFTFIEKVSQSMLSHKMPFYDKLGKVIGVFGLSINLNDNQSLFSDLSNPVKNNSAFSFNLPSRQVKVSPRERECLYYLMRGETAKEIARRLNLSPRTIEFYIENMKKKFSCSNRIELIAKIGLIE